MKLFDFQNAGVELLYNHSHYCLFWDVGVGKTITAITALNMLPRGKVLICSPKRVQENMWKLLDYPINHDVEFINYELMPYRNLTPKYNYILLDEAHHIKGDSSHTKVCRIINSLAKGAERVWALTGTPAANNYLDTFRILKHMNIAEFQYPDAAFIARYYVTYPIKVKTRWGEKTINKPVKIRDMFSDELMTTFGQYSNSVKLDDVHNLPAQHTRVVRVKGMCTEKYQAIEQGVVEISKELVSVVARLEANNKAHQAANGYIYYTDLNTGQMRAKKLFTDVNPKLQALKQEISDIGADRAIIVYKFKYDKMLIERELTAMKIEFTSDMREFEDNQILLLQISCGEGVNLQKLSRRIIFYSYDYSFVSFYQMKGRIYRIGQEDETYFIILCSEGTIEEDVYQSILLKQSLDDYLKASTKRIVKKYE